MREYSAVCVDLRVLDVSDFAVRHVLCPYLFPIDPRFVVPFMPEYCKDNFTRFAFFALTGFESLESVRSLYFS